MNPNQTQTIPLDPQVVNLAKSIRTVESGGNFSAKGKSGEMGGYQWMPDTWKGHAKDVLGDENAPMTPSNQNAVAYTIIKQWKDQGLNPAEIAAKWNSGTHKGWENKVGTNGQGVAYDVPAYVKKVTDTYQSLKAQGLGYSDVQAQTAVDTTGAPVPGVSTPQPEEKSWLRKVGDFFTGGTQRFGKTIGEALAAPRNAELYQDAYQQWSTVTDNLNAKINEITKAGGDPSRLQRVLKRHLIDQPKLESFTGDVINKTPEQVLGEAGMAGLEALSGGLLEGGVKTVASKELGVLGKLNQAGKLGATYGAVGGGLSAMEQNKDISGVAGGAALGGTLGYALGGATAGAGMVAGKVVGSIEKSGIASKLLPETEARIAKTEAWVKEAEQKVAKAYEDSLPLTPTQKLREQNLLNKKGDNLYTTLAKYNIEPSSKDALVQLQSISDQFENAVNHARTNEHALFNLDEMVNNAFHDVNQNLVSETAREAAKTKIVTEVSALLKANKGSLFNGANGERLVDSQFMERLRGTGNSWTPFNASDPERIGKSAGWALANAVRDQVEKQGTFPAYREANREWSKVIHAQQMLQKIADSGKTFKTIGGLGGSIGRKILSGVLGFHSGGIAGAILAELGSEYGAKILANPKLRTYFNRRLIERFGNSKATPEAILALENEIRMYVDTQASLPKLNAPSTIYVPPTQGGLPYTPNAAGHQTTPVVETTKLPRGGPGTK